MMSYVSVSDSDTVWAAGGGCQVAPGPSRASLAAGTVSVAQPELVIQGFAGLGLCLGH